MGWTWFNGAGDVHRRKGAREGRPRRTRGGFNGAGDVHRPEGRSSSPARSRPSASFNGAGDVHRRKGSRLRGSLPPHQYLLQRGRRRSSPEGSISPGHTSARRVVLQRGRRRSSPEGSWRPISNVSVNALQRGRRRSSPEGRSMWWQRVRAARGFNGAGDVHRRKAASVMPLSAIQPRGFNGASDVHRRKVQHDLAP